MMDGDLLMEDVPLDEVEEPAQTKTCPQCGQELFADMGVCYGCLHDFRRGHARVELQAFPEEDGGQSAPGDVAAPSTPAGPCKSAQGRRLGIHVQTGDVDVTIPLTGSGVTVGRLPSNDIVLHCRAVSKYQLRIVAGDDCASIEDRGGTNPVILQGREVTNGQEIEIGSTLDVCGSLLTLVRYDGSPDAS